MTMHLQLGLTIHHCEGQMFVFVISTSARQYMYLALLLLRTASHAVAPMTGADSLLLPPTAKSTVFGTCAAQLLKFFGRGCGGVA